MLKPGISCFCETCMLSVPAAWGGGAGKRGRKKARCSPWTLRNYHSVDCQPGSAFLTIEVMDVGVK